MLKDLLKIVDWREVRLIGILLVPVAALEVLTLIAIRLFFMTLSGAQPPSSIVGSSFSYHSDNHVGIVPIVGLTLIVWLIIRSVLSHLIWGTMVRATTQAQSRVLKLLFTQYIAMSLTERFEKTLSEQKHMLFLSAQGMFHQVLLPVTSVLVEIVIAVAIAVTLFWFEPMATVLLATLFALFFALYQILLRPKARAVGQQRWQALHAMRKVTDGALGDLRWIKITNSESVFFRLFASEIDLHSKALARDRALALVPRYVADIAIILAIVVLYNYFDAAEAGSGFALFAAAALRLIPALYKVVAISHNLSVHAPDLGQVVDQLTGSKERELSKPKLPSQHAFFENQLSFENVTFGYPDQETRALSDVSITINAGEKVHLTGASGSGKSTLLSLMIGLLTPTEGKISLDGKKQSILDTVRGSSIALVSQDPFILTGTVADNIIFPFVSDTLEDVRAQNLLKRLGLDWSLDRAVGENGTRLSGGERQRLAIARALYLRPKFLILDEATSQLGKTTADDMYDMIFDICAESTVLICSHQQLPEGYDFRHLHISNGTVTEVATP
jgi:ATP-binding cassette subfamily C protein